MKAGRWMLGMVLLAGATYGAVLKTDFNDLPLSPTNNYWNGSDLSHGFAGDGMFFINTYDTQWGSWSGFAYSKVNDTNTAGYGNQHAVWTPGTDVDGTGKYAVFFASSFSEDRIIFASPSLVRGFYINNTTYAALTMRDGNAFAKKFGGATGDDPDWLKVTIIGLDSDSQIVGSNDVYLADYRFTNNAQDYILSDWKWVDLTGFGSEVKYLAFYMFSSDTGRWGMNTPAYFAMDNLEAVASADGDTITFDDLPLNNTNYWNGSNLMGYFYDQFALFHNSYNTNWNSWAGFAYSQVNDTNTAGYGNQYAVWTPGTGMNATGKYAVVFDSSFDNADVVEFFSPVAPKGFYVNNTTYAALTMLNGNAFAKKFGGVTGDDPDWFKLTISGQDADHQSVGTNVDFYLADYRFTNNAQDYVVGDWTWVDLSPLGTNVQYLNFTLSSSDNSSWGMNTPAYFAMDNLQFKAVSRYGVSNGEPNDYSGERVSDLAVFDENTGRWFVRKVAGDVVAWDINWGWPGVTPVAGDYNGDGKADLAVFDENTGRWFVRKVDGAVIASDVNWGWPGVTPVAGDYNGDGIADLAVFDENTGRWFIRSVDGTVIANNINWGWPGVTPVAGDYNGDGKADLAIFDENTGRWFIRGVDGAVIAWDVNWGWPGVTPVAGDYNGDGKADLAVFDENTGRWFIQGVDKTQVAWDINWGWPGVNPVGK